jgi:ABC-type molybdate transport system substrate-binding protein
MAAVLQRLAPICETAAGINLVFNFGASSDLARQIIDGDAAPAENLQAMMPVNYRTIWTRL